MGRAYPQHMKVANGGTCLNDIVLCNMVMLYRPSKCPMVTHHWLSMGNPQPPLDDYQWTKERHQIVYSEKMPMHISLI